MAAATEEEQVALGLQRRGRHVVERAASKGRGAWCSNSCVLWRAVPVYRAATRRGKRVRNCCALNSVSRVARRRGEHEAKSVWLPWHVGHTGAHVFVYLVTPRGRCLPRWHPHMLPSPEENENRTQSTATMKQANSTVTVFATTLPKKVWV